MTPISFLPANDNSDDFPTDAEIKRRVEEYLADLSFHECHAAAELGPETIPGAYSDEDAAELNAEFDDRRQRLIEMYRSDRR